MCHILSEAEHFNFSFKPIVHHDIELADLTDHIDYICIEVLVYYRLMQFEAIFYISYYNPA